MRVFDRAARLWERNASTDALWAILALPGKEGRRWQRDEFYRTGERDAAELMRSMAEHAATPRPGRALDFGCGVGRLTRAFASWFERVDGVDVSPTMIELAERYARVDDRCHYWTVLRPDLGLFPDGSFDLVCSILVLQHIPSPFAAGYVREFGRVAAPGGIVLFQAPHARRRPPERRGILRRAAARLLRPREVTLEMYALPRDVAQQVLADSGCEVIDVRSDGWAGDEWESFIYLARKVAASAGPSQVGVEERRV